MRAAASTAEFLNDPYGRYFVGRRTIVYAHSSTLIGLDLFGTPSIEDIRELLALCAIELEPKAAPHFFIADTRHCEHLDAAAFAKCVEWGVRNRHILAEKVTRSIMLRTNGMLGAAITGFARVVKLPVMQQVFEDEAEAVEWLGLDLALGNELFREVDAIRDSVFGESPIVRKLRALLDAEGALPAAIAARRLGLSTRSLQRALEQAGTTFRQETLTFRINRAKALLADESRPLGFIAREVGFTSVQTFATTFRAAVGVPPSAWRQANTGGTKPAILDR